MRPYYYSSRFFLPRLAERTSYPTCNGISHSVMPFWLHPSLQSQNSKLWLLHSHSSHSCRKTSATLSLNPLKTLSSQSCRVFQSYAPQMAYIVNRPYLSSPHFVTLTVHLWYPKIPFQANCTIFRLRIISPSTELISSDWGFKICQRTYSLMDFIVWVRRYTCSRVLSTKLFLQSSSHLDPYPATGWQVLGVWKLDFQHIFQLEVDWYPTWSGATF